ncbi:MAG: flagellar basal body P-ring formation chaperone FlgA [Chloroflexota bacterium]
MNIRSLVPSNLGMLAALLAWQGLFVPPIAHAAHSLDDINATVRQFIDESLPPRPDMRREVQINPLDPRLRLAECDKPLQAFTPGSQLGGGSLTVGVRCEGSSPWKIYVSARIKVFRPVVIANRPLPKGSPVNLTDVELQERDVTRLTDGFFTDPHALAGMLAKRPLASGEILSTSNLQAPTLVNKGDKVRIVARPGAFEVIMMGEAMRDGGLRDRIPVRNLSSGRVVEAIISGAGEVEIVF